MATTSSGSPANPVPADLNALLGPIYAQLNTVNAILSGFIAADLAAAEASAQAAGDAVGVLCWQTIAKLPVQTIPQGAGVAWLKQLFRNWQNQFTAVNQNCASVAPLFTKGYNLLMIQIAGLSF